MNSIESIKEKLNGENVGFIGNFISRVVLDQFFKTIELTRENIVKELTDNQITFLVFDTDIHENDNEWKNMTKEELMNIVEPLNIKIMTLGVQLDLHPQSQEYFDITISNQISSIMEENNQIYLPLLLDELQFNPMNENEQLDILYLDIGNGIQLDNLSNYIERFNVRHAHPLAITRSVIKSILHFVKNTKIVFFVDNEMPKFLSKFIELACVFQNTLPIIFTQKSDFFEYGYSVSNEELALSYIRFSLKNSNYTNRLKVGSSRHSMMRYSNSWFLSGTPNVSVVVVSMRRSYLKTFFTDIAKQKNVNIEVVLLTHGFELGESEQNLLAEIGNCELKTLSSPLTESFGNCLNKCLTHISYDYVIKMDDDDDYEENFILDFYLAHKYTNAEVVGKFGFYFYLEHSNLVGMRRHNRQNRFVGEVKGNGIFCKSSLLKDYAFSDLPRHIDSDLFKRITDDGGRIYCIHPYDMCVFRASDKNKHSYQVNDLNFLRDAETIYFGKPNDTIRSVNL